MQIKKYIPNTITLCNLLCGVVATIFAYNGYYQHAAALFLLGVTFDFLDGFTARMLHVKSEIGKELDSFADCITSGLLPSMVMYTMMQAALSEWSTDWVADWLPVSWAQITSGAAFLIVLFSALRLAIFNLDIRQTESFIGLPTPACGLIVVFLPFLREMPYLNVALTNYWVLLVITVVLSLLLVSELPLFALKFKNFGWAGNQNKWILISVSAILIILLGWKAFPLIIIFYLILSFLALMKKGK